jgi:hypothetical protein
MVNLLFRFSIYLKTVKIFLAYYDSLTSLVRMRVAPPISPIRAIALLPRARTGHGREEGATVPAAAHFSVTPVRASAAFLAQSIAQELMPEVAAPSPGFPSAYRTAPSAAFEGLNFRAIA